MHPRLPGLLLAFLLLALPFLTRPTLAQERSVGGVVTAAEDGTPLPGVSVGIKGTTVGTITGVDGTYRLSVGSGATLTFSFVGTVTQEIVVTTQTTLDVSLRANETELETLVVTGYQSEKRKNISGAVTVVTPRDFKDIPVVGVDQALQGQAAGVLVTQSSGTPGGGIMVRIRGNTSISASNRPIFVVDGVRIDAGGVSDRDFGGQQDNALASINPNDVESIAVLKDAAAKAIYGSSGANGVVVITTRRGRAARTAVTLDVQRGMIDPVRRLPLLNATQLLGLQREAVTNAGGNPDAQGLVPGVTDAVNTDWQRQVLRTGIYQQYQLTFAGGDARTRLYTNLAYRDEEGVQRNNRFERYTGTFNLDHQLNKKFSLGSSLLLSRTKNFRVKGDNFLDGVYSGAVKSLPYYAPYDEQGKLIGPGSPAYAGFPNFNPLGQALLPRFEVYVIKLIGSFFLTYDVSPRLRVTSRFSTDYSSSEENQYEPSGTAIGGFLPSVGGRGYGVNTTTSSARVMNTTTATYSRTFAEKHNLNALLGTEIIQNTTRTASVQGRLYPNDNFTYIRSAGIVDAGDSYFFQSGLLSFFTQVRYDFEEKYLFSALVRTDASSRFGAARRYGFFPAVSAAWRISAEPFMKEIGWVSDLKLRASAGISGNQEIGDFQFLSRFSAATYSGNTGVGPSGLPNRNLSWESTREVNVGLDADLLSGRVQVTAEAYSNLTNNLLFAQPLPLTTGFASLTGNIGSVSNQGVELGITTVNYDGVFRWTSTLNLSRNLNRVESLTDSLPIFRGYTAANAGRTNVVVPGQPLGTFWGLQFLGVDPGTGNALYQDRNGDGRITPADATVIGNAQPDFIGGFTNRFSYKGFDLNVFFQFSVGNSILNFSKTTLLNAGEDLQNNQTTDALRRWQREGDITDVPRYVSGNLPNNWHSNRFLEDGSYLRLKNVSLGYNLPKVLLNRLKMSNARVYVSGTNVWTLTRYSGSDPEVSTLDGSTTAQGIDFFTLPQVRTLMAGLTIGF